MIYVSSEFWNKFFNRFLIAFTFWEALGIPLRILFFAKLYEDTSFKSYFLTVGEIYWPFPFLVDLIQVFFIGLVSVFTRREPSGGIASGIFFGIFFSLGAYFSTSLLLMTFTTIPRFPLLMTAIVLSIQTIIATSIFFIESTDSE
ncbi:MAG: hypothetical protein L6Q54_13605 [Leptospiraceae bacterium]|nr:hypothetical protein [Leptospiraceae bacterium]MCK6382270.1 hypothetical protein [Leptospiraceae bacterium]NUM41879.1 hypothetical protein [Leptospiraceae bacterium]